MKALKKKTKKYVVEVHQEWGWCQSNNEGANKTYATKEEATKRARIQELKSTARLKYRAKALPNKEIK
jgi:hypothetical protein